MAKKDTMKALLDRGIEPEIVERLLTTYNSLKSITEAGTEGLVEFGLTEGEAKDVVAKVGKRPSRSSSSSSSKAKKAEDIEVVHMEPVSKHREPTVMEQKLLGYEAEMGYDLPLKVIVDIAARLEAVDGVDGVKEETCRTLLVTANRMYQAHRMDAHESAGVMAAHSIGEPGTQMNMRTFHNAGVANILTTPGLPRLIEVVDARRIPSTPSMDIPLRGLAASDQNIARLVAYNLDTTALIDIAQVETDDTNLRLVITPDRRKMDDRAITMDDIVERLNKIKILRGLVKATDYEIIVSEDSGELPSFKKLQALYDAVKNAKVKGIDGISRAVITRDKDDKGNELGWKLVTEGSNLKEVLKVDGVDAEKTKTNSVLEIADVLGIEAARSSIINEAIETLSNAGLNVDIRHIMLVADLMTNDGYVKAIGRHGISGKKSSVLARAAFEITTPHLLHAAMNGEVDRLEGVAENIIVGQPVTLGTGAVNLIYSPKKKKGYEE